jgi:hypothetical protein
MSEKGEEFAGRLLESTQAGRLKWSAVTDPETESYKHEGDDRISFNIKRVGGGDADSVAKNALVREQALSFMLSRRSESQPSAASDAQIKRFRLDSDLFFAARETAEGQDQAIEQSPQFLSRLA